MKLKKILSLLTVVLLTVFMSGGSLSGFTAKADENVPVNRIDINCGKQYLVIGSTMKLTAMYNNSPSADVKEDSNVIWVTSDANTISIDNTGTVKALALGNAIVTALSQDGQGNASIFLHVISEEEEKANETAANAVIAKINALPDHDKLLFADKAQVEDAENAYNSLSDAQKELVTNTNRYTDIVSMMNTLIRWDKEDHTPVPDKIDNNEHIMDEVINAIRKGVKVPPVYITDNPTVSQYVFNEIRACDDESITFIGNNVSYTFNGKDMPADIDNDVDLSLKAVSGELKTKETAKAKDTIGKDSQISAFSFTNNSQFPGTASIKVLTSKDWGNKNVDLYRFNEDKNSCEKIQGNVKTDADGYITFTTNYGGDYFIVDTAASTNADSKTISIVNNPSVSKDVFNGIKGSDKSVTFTGNNVIWTFSGKDITSELNNDIDLSLRTVSDGLKSKEAAKIKDAAGKDVSFVPFSFTYDGPLPGTASIKVFISKDWAGKTVNVYRYHEDTNSYELIQSDITVDNDGYITYNTNHCSDYFAADASSLPKSDSQNNSNTNTATNSDTSTVKTNSTETVTSNTVPTNTNAAVTTTSNSNNTAKAKLPKTGSSIDSLRVMGIGILFIALGSIVTIICSRKKRKTIIK